MAQRVAVIGLGCAGLAACASLARRGIEVVGLDQFDIGHDRGSSAHQSRGFRLAYYEHPDYVPLLKASREHWMQLNAMAAEPIFIETGGVYISKKDAELVPMSIDAARQHGIDHDVLSAAEVRKRWPIFDITDDMIGLYEPLAGVIVPERALAMHATIAREGGADLRTGVQILSWKDNGTEVEILTDAGLVYCDRLVLCTGAWANSLLSCEQIDIRPSRQVLVWFQSPSNANIDAPAFPFWAIELDDRSLLYGFPRMSGLPGPVGFKVARHWAGPTIDPDDDCDKAVAPGDEDDVSRHVAKWLPDAIGPATDVRTCMYANSTDGHFRIGLHPDSSRVVIVWIDRGTCPVSGDFESHRTGKPTHARKPVEEGAVIKFNRPKRECWCVNVRVRWRLEPYEHLP